MNLSCDALRWKGRSISRGLLDQYIHSTSRHLKEFGIKQRSAVVISAVLSPAYVIVLLSLWHLKAVPYLVDLHLQDQSLCALKLDRGSLILVDEKQGPLSSQVLLNDMVALELVEGFLGEKGDPSFYFDPALQAAILVDAQGKLVPVTFGELLTGGDGREIMGLEIHLQPLHDQKNLRVFCRAILAGRTIVL